MMKIIIMIMILIIMIIIIIIIVNSGLHFYVLNTITKA